MKKEKQVFRKKEDILNDLKDNKVFQEKLAFVREKFWPTLCKAAPSIDDAQIFLGGFNTALMQGFLALMKEKKMSDLFTADKLEKESESYIPVVELFNDMSVFDAKDYIEGMKSEISLFLTEENKERKLDTLKTTWIDQM